MAKAKCQRTGTLVELEDGFFLAKVQTGEWFFVCKTAPEEHADYNIAVSQLLSNPVTFCNWMGHLEEKTWFVPDKFINFFAKFRRENNLYQ